MALYSTGDNPLGCLLMCLLLAIGNSVPVTDEDGENALESGEWSTQNFSTGFDLPEDFSAEMKIVRGSFAEEGEFPHQVALVRLPNNHLFCGGSIIHPRLILTAAHCLHNELAGSIKIIAGVNDWTLQTGQTRKAKFIYNHENYDKNSTSNDISLIELDSPLQFNSLVSSINLPQENESFRGYAKVVGWGKTSMHWLNPGSKKLQTAKLPIVPNESCKEHYKKSKNPVRSSNLCAGGTGTDTCQVRDSGGPAICKRRDSSQVLCGVTSFGIGCGIEGIPGVYARTASYINWISFMKNKILTREKCRSDYFFCSSGTGCIPRAFLCDSHPDCEGSLSGAEDEQNCKSMGSCQRFQFRCNNGQCVDQADVCNRVNDCGDSSDEEKCPTKSCGVDQHRCGFKGRCIPNLWKCDDEQDCDDGSDEDACEFDDETADNDNQIDVTGSTCPSFFWRCGNGRCIYHQFRCDGDDDCADGSDERGCTSH